MGRDNRRGKNSRDRRSGRGQSENRFDAGSFRSSFGGGGNFRSGPKEMHKATCADCKNECEVPFKPTEGRPVYCRECFGKHKPQRF